jgi:hypothetical protein
MMTRIGFSGHAACAGVEPAAMQAANIPTYATRLNTISISSGLNY